MSKHPFPARKFALAGAIMIAAVNANAQVVIDQPGAGGSAIQVLAFSPLGQSFAAVSASIASIGARLINFNVNAPAFLADLTLTLNLYQGSGFGGLLLDTSTVNVAALLGNAEGAVATIDFPIDPMGFTPGSTYTFSLVANTPRYGVATAGANLYAGGQAFYNNITSITPPELNDLTFRVTAVPEPGMTWLMAAGLFGLALRRRLS